MELGYVYCLSNPSFNNWYKVGYTKRTPEERCQELSGSTGVPLPFKIEFAKQVVDYKEKEKLLHTKLEKYRVNTNREFFNAPLRSIRVLFEEIEGTWYKEEEEVKNNLIDDLIISFQNLLVFSSMFVNYTYKNKNNLKVENKNLKNINKSKINESNNSNNCVISNSNNSHSSSNVTSQSTNKSVHNSKQSDESEYRQSLSNVNTQKLTPRLKQIYDLFMKGNSIAQIALLENIKETTVRNYLNKCKKLSNE